MRGKGSKCIVTSTEIQSHFAMRFNHIYIIIYIYIYIILYLLFTNIYVRYERANDQLD
jgi:hypothetical protein